MQQKSGIPGTNGKTKELDTQHGSWSWVKNKMGIRIFLQPQDLAATGKNYVLHVLLVCYIFSSGVSGSGDQHYLKHLFPVCPILVDAAPKELR